MPLPTREKRFQKNARRFIPLVPLIRDTFKNTINSKVITNVIISLRKRGLHKNKTPNTLLQNYLHKKRRHHPAQTKRISLYHSSFSALKIP